jgi:hypothetical protein
MKKRGRKNSKASDWGISEIWRGKQRVEMSQKGRGRVK